MSKLQNDAINAEETNTEIEEFAELNFKPAALVTLGIIIGATTLFGIHRLLNRNHSSFNDNYPDINYGC